MGKLLKTALFAAISGVFVAYLLQPSFLYFPRKYTSRDRTIIKQEIDRRGLKLEELDYAVRSYTNQRSYLILPLHPVSSKSFHLIVFFGGNGMTGFDAIVWFMNMRSIFEDSTNQYAFLAVDYPGYGHSDGDPSPEAIHESVRVAFGKAIEQLNDEYGIKPVDATIIGHSLGSAVATSWLAKDPPDSIPIRHLVLSAPFTSIADMASHIFGLPRMLSWMISRHNWDNEKALKQLIESGVVGGKVTVIHGTMDEIVPLHMGVKLGKLSPPKTRLIPLNDYSHNNILDSYKVYAYAISE